MIRMILIYTGLFAAAAVALWLRPDVAAQEQASLVTKDAGQSALILASSRPTARPSPQPVVLNTVSDEAMDRFRNQNGLASLIVRELEQDASGAAIARLGETADGAVDLAPLLEVPGSIRTQDGTRVLASALMRQQQTQQPSLAEEITNISTISVSPDPDARFYTVKEGDSLASIARTHYGSTSAYAEIYAANRDVLKTMDAIRVGQRLRLP